MLTQSATSFFVAGELPGLPVVVWLLLAVLVGPCAGRAARATASPTWIGAACGAGYTGILLGEALFVLRFESALDRLPLVILDLSLGLLLPAFLLAGSRDRMRGYALLPLMAMAAATVILYVKLYGAILLDS